jgi:hypothetical protein
VAVSNFDFLATADVFVADATGAMEQMIDRLGFPAQRSSAIHRHDGWGYEAYFARVHPDMTIAPTRIEVISAWGWENPELPVPYLGEMYKRLGDRPIKAHATVVAARDVAGLAKRLNERGVRSKLDPSVPVLPYPRLWVGRSEDAPLDYDPDADGSLFLEFLPTEAIRELKAHAWEVPTAQLGPADGSMVRVIEKSFVVDDLDAVVATLLENLGWIAEPVVTTLEQRSAVLSFNLPQSARLRVIEPTDSSTVCGALLKSGGPGPYAIRIAVNGLAEKVADLDARGTRSSEFSENGTPVVSVDLRAECGQVFEFVEYVPVAADQARR